MQVEVAGEADGQSAAIPALHMRSESGLRASEEHPAARHDHEVVAEVAEPAVEVARLQEAKVRRLGGKVGLEKVVARTAGVVQDERTEGADGLIRLTRLGSTPSFPGHNEGARRLRTDHPLTALRRVPPRSSRS